MLLSNQEKIDQIGSARYVDNLSSGHVPILFLHRMDMIIKFMCWPAGTWIGEAEKARWREGVNLKEEDENIYIFIIFWAHECIDIANMRKLFS